eukprot:251242-Prorocentrum_minimum.AAC.2
MLVMLLMLGQEPALERQLLQLAPEPRVRRLVRVPDLEPAAGELAAQHGGHRRVRLRELRREDARDLAHEGAHDGGRGGLRRLAHHALQRRSVPPHPVELLLLQHQRLRHRARACFLPLGLLKHRREVVAGGGRLLRNLLAHGKVQRVRHRVAFERLGGLPLGGNQIRQAVRPGGKLRLGLRPREVLRLASVLRGHGSERAGHGAGGYDAALRHDLLQGGHEFALWVGARRVGARRVGARRVGAGKAGRHAGQADRQAGQAGAVDVALLLPLGSRLLPLSQPPPGGRPLRRPRRRAPFRRMPAGPSAREDTPNATAPIVGRPRIPAREFLMRLCRLVVIRESPHGYS